MNFIGGLSYGFHGARQGQRDALDREQSEQDRQFQIAQRGVLEEQQAFQRSQRQRIEGEQARADKLRSDLGGIRTTETVSRSPDVPMDDEGNPMPKVDAERQRPQDAVLRDVANAYRDAGDIGRFFELNGAADAMAYKRAAGEFNQVLAASKDTPLGDLARQVGGIFDSDPTNGGVKSIQDIPGGVRVTLANRDTGQSVTRDFVGEAGKQQLLQMAQAHYAPEQIAKQLEQARKERLEMLKHVGVKAVPQGYVTTDADMRSTFTRTDDGSTGGTGSKGGAAGAGAPGEPNFLDGFPEKDALKQAAEMVDKQIADGAPMTPQQRAQAIQQNYDELRLQWVTSAQRRYVISQAVSILRRSSPADYAKNYDKLVANGIPPALLEAEGFKPPPKPLAAAAAAAGGPPAPARAESAIKPPGGMFRSDDEIDRLATWRTD